MFMTCDQNPHPCDSGIREAINRCDPNLMLDRYAKTDPSGWTGHGDTETRACFMVLASWPLRSRQHPLRSQTRLFVCLRLTHWTGILSRIVV